MKKGIIWAFVAATISGFSIYANGLFVTKVDPVTFTFWRNLAVAIIFGSVLIFQKRQIRSTNFKKIWEKLVLIGVIGGGIPFVLFFVGLSRMGALGANLINKSLFLWVAMLAVIFLKEKLNWISVIGYGIVFFGLFGINGLPNIQNGALLVLGATIFWAVEHVIAKKVLPETTPLIVSLFRMLFGLPVIAVAVILTGKTFSLPTLMALPAIGVSAILLSLYMSTWYLAIKYAPVTIVSSILVLAPIGTMIWQLIFAGKSFGIRDLSAPALMILGVGLIINLPKILKLRARVYGA